MRIKGFINMTPNLSKLRSIVYVATLDKSNILAFNNFKQVRNVLYRVYPHQKKSNVRKVKKKHYDRKIHKYWNYSVKYKGSTKKYKVKYEI